MLAPFARAPRVTGRGVGASGLPYRTAAPRSEDPIPPRGRIGEVLFGLVMLGLGAAGVSIGLSPMHRSELVLGLLVALPALTSIVRRRRERTRF